MKLFREISSQRTVRFTGILKWYEGFVCYNIEKDTYTIAIIPLNIVLRLLRGLYYWTKIGVWITGRETKVYE